MYIVQGLKNIISDLENSKNELEKKLAESHDGVNGLSELLERATADISTASDKNEINKKELSDLRITLHDLQNENEQLKKTKQTLEVALMQKRGDELKIKVMTE